MTVVDKDRGLKRVYAQAARVPRTLEVGIFDRKVNRYAPIIESRFHFMRAAFDRMLPKVGKDTKKLHVVVLDTGDDPATAEVALAENLADAVRHSIQSMELIKTGDMLGAISVREAKAK